MEIKDLMVGDEVYCSRWGEWPIVWRKSKVEKINTTVLVLVDGVWYGKDGFPNDKSSRIYTIDDETARGAYEAQQKEKFVRSMVARINSDGMTYEQAVKIKEILEDNEDGKQ